MGKVLTNRHVCSGIIIGKPVVTENNILAFTLKYDDDDWFDEDGNKQYDTSYVRVYCRGFKNPHDWLSRLIPGRRTAVQGKVRASAFKREDGSLGANLNMNSPIIEFLDNRLEDQVENIFNLLKDSKYMEDGVVNCTKEEALQVVKDYTASLSEKEPF
jgi:hypothetical protein